VSRFPRIIQYFFLAYLLFWSFFVSLALMSACGVTAHAMLPIVDATNDKFIYAVIHSLLAIALVRWGGFQLFEKVMRVCIAMMFVTVILAAIAVKPDWGAVVAGLCIPTIPQLTTEGLAWTDGLAWTVALMGGVGGTLTVLCYGYWIREEGRESMADLKTCRIDLATGYIMTAVFGICMVILGSEIEVTGKGSKLVVQLAEKLETSLASFGPVLKWAFLLGAWGAVSSSLLGVWQCVPYLFTDFCNQMGWTARSEQSESKQRVDPTSRCYRGFLYAMALIPIICLIPIPGLTVNFQQAQKVYAIVGAAFMPMLAAALLALNSSKWIGRENRNSVLTIVVLVMTLVFFLIFVEFQIYAKFFAN
jgi:Mn2+/Fe2+ NRAMP family transporter